MMWAVTKEVQGQGTDTWGTATEISEIGKD